MLAFQSPKFRRLWFSTLASASASGMERTTTAWLALETGGGAVALGLVLAGRSLPSLLLGLAAGTVADRVDRARQLLAVGGLAALLAAGFGLLVLPGGIQVWQVVAFGFAAGCLQVFDTPARQALIMDTVPRDAAVRTLALNALGGQLSAASGSFLAGALIPVIGVAGCYLVVGGFYALMALLVAGLRVEQSHRDVEASPFRHALRDAARLMIDVPVLGVLVAAGVACEILAFSFGTALPVFAQSVLAAGPEGLGTLNAAVAIGGALAISMLSMLPGHIRREPLLGTVFILFGVCMMVVALTRDLWLAAAVLLVLGFSAAAYDVLLQTLMQMAVPDQQRGRAVGVWVFCIGSGPVGFIEMGFLVGALGAPLGLMINGALTVLAALVLYRGLVRQQHAVAAE